MNYYEHHIGEPFDTELREAIKRRDLADSPREKSRANAQIRSIRLRAARAKATHCDEEWGDLVSRLGNRCACCGVYGTSVQLQKDHIVPIYQGGSDGIENLQPLCVQCNTAKGPENFNWAAYRLEKGFDE